MLNTAAIVWKSGKVSTKNTTLYTHKQRISVKILNLRFFPVLLALIPVCVFLNALYSGFVYDDIGIIEDNYFIRSLHNIPKIFSKDYFQLSHELTYRPVVTLSYFIDYAIWHLNSFGYHLANVILHTINTVLLYFLLVWLIRIRSAALLSAVIFSIHPCVTEAVNAIGYREDLLVTLFSFSSFLCLIRSGREYPVLYGNKFSHLSLQGERTQGGSDQSLQSGRPAWKVWTCYAFSLVFYLLGLFSKETALVTPLFIILYWALCVRRGIPPSHPAQRRGGVSSAILLPDNYKFSHSLKVKWLFYFFNYYLGYILISLFYLWIRFFILKNPLEVSAGYIKGSITVNFMTMVKILASYIKLMFLPIHLSADYTIAPVLSAFDVSFIISIILLVTTGIIIFKVINTTISFSGLSKDRMYGLFMLCFFLSLLPVLNIVPIGHIMAERYLYLPVAGFCAVIGGLLLCRFPVYGQPPPMDINGVHSFNLYNQSATVFKGERHNTPNKTRSFDSGFPGIPKYTSIRYALIISLISIVSIFFVTRTILRNRDWRDEYTFWTKILEEQPQNYDAHNNLGNYFYKQGKLDKAVSELEEAVRLKKNYPEGHNSLGTMYIDKGFIDKAISEYTEAIKYKPIFPEAYYNLGNACIKKGLVDDSMAFYRKAISMGMYNPQVFNNLGSAYMKKGMINEAEKQYKKALLIYRDFAEVHSNLGYIYTERGDLGKATLELKEALRLQPNHANAHNNLGAIYCQEGLWDKAQDEFLLAVKLDPKNASAHKNIGVIYFTRGDKQRAKEHFIQMLKYDPNYIKDRDIFTIVLQLGLVKEINPENENKM